MIQEQFERVTLAYNANPITDKGQAKRVLISRVMNERRRTQQSSSKSADTTREYSNVTIGPSTNPANDSQLLREAAF